MSGSRDLHHALKTEKLSTAQGQGISFSLIRMQWGKDDVAVGLHAYPNSYSTAGLQITDILAYLGFRLSNCAFGSVRCYSRWVSEGFDLNGFGSALERIRQHFLAAETGFQSCGFQLPQPEGWAYFTGRSSHPRQQRWARGDGHTASDTQHLKQSEDSNFRFRFTFIKGAGYKGWTTHLVSKQDLAQDLNSALALLSLKTFPQCPEFGFSPCRYYFLEKEEDNHGFDQRTQFINAAFDQLSSKFSPSLDHLVQANAEAQRFGMTVFKNVGSASVGW